MPLIEQSECFQIRIAKAPRKFDQLARRLERTRKVVDHEQQTAHVHP